MSLIETTSNILTPRDLKNPSRDKYFNHVVFSPIFRHPGRLGGLRVEQTRVHPSSDAAVDRVKSLMDREGAGYLRVGVKNGGCAGMEYVMDYVSEPDALDERVEDKGVEIVVDSKSLLFLLGSQIDYEVTSLHAKFGFRNPNETDACGCGESVTLVAAKA